MGKTYRQQHNKYEDETRGIKKGRHPGHANGRKTGGMRILNDVYMNEEEDFFSDDIDITDEVIINRHSDNSR